MIAVRDLSVSLHGAPILANVALDLAPGTVVGLVGESGSGKSMTALALMRLLPDGAAASGTVALDGTDLMGLSERAMCARRGRDIAMIFQEPMTALNPVQTIGHQVAETLTVHATPRAEALRTAADRLARAGLPPDRFPPTRYPHELSGGERQRVSIAMAVATRPRLLIADEPTTALDVTTQARILALLRELVAEEGMSLLLITHDLAVVAGLADHTAVMAAGRIVESAPTAELFTAMRQPATRALLAATGHTPARARASSPVPLLAVRDAVRAYPLPRGGLLARPAHHRAVDGVSLTLHRGESLGLVGGSGCGKSTLTRAILGLDPLDSGTIYLGGDRVGPGPVPAALRRRMQVVFQDPYASFDPRHRVARLIGEPFHLTGRPPDAADRIAQALADVGLAPEDGGKFIHEFSGGERQRIAIARALIIRPDLIVLDEAVSALDVSVRARVLDLLAELQARYGLAYLFISHDLGVVRAVADRVLVMQAGRIVEEGDPDRVFTAPDHPYTQDLAASAPRIPAAWRPAAATP